MMKKKKFFRIYLIGLVFSIIFCTGCQKRQKTENLHILSEKETAHTGETKKSESGLKEVLQIPDKLEKEMESYNKKNKVEIQAKILVPQVKSIPERTIMPRSYTQEETEAMIETIFPDGILYKMEDYTIEEESYCQVSGWNKAYNGKKYMFFLTDYHRLQNELSSATAMISGPAIQLVRSGSEKDEWIAEGLTKGEVENRQQYTLPKITEKEALEAAKEMMEKCFLTDYSLFSTGYTLLLNSENGNKKTAYEFLFFKEVDQVRVFAIEDILEVPIGQLSITPILSWVAEGVKIVVDEDGVYSLDGGSDGVYSEAEGTNTLLSFQEIEKIMEAALLEEGQDEKTMKISHIELGYARVWNSSDEKPEMKATLKPAWAFYGKTTGKSGNREITSEYGDKNLLLAIDAATGEVLELTE